jgi:predicted TIM-barrel fold metal-dependent hydrolase
MGQMAIISVDGHVKASRALYRGYVERSFLDTFDDWVRAQEAAGVPDTGNVNPAFDVSVQWDSERRLEALAGEGVVAEVLFPNGLPFANRRFEDAARAEDAALSRAARMAHNRWLAEFCAEAPGRRAGQALIAFDDIDQAVADVYWAKEHGLGGVMMPALEPGDRFFFDPALDPVWAAIEEVGLPISQHGGSGAPAYSPAGFAAILTLAIEHSFFSGRSLWQMILGGVFERFPKLQLVFVETGANWIAPAIRQLDRRIIEADDWVGFAVFMKREKLFSRLPSEYWATNCHAGISPFAASQLDFDDLSAYERGIGVEAFRIGSDKAMFGVDFPHVESLAPRTKDRVAELVAHPAITADDARKILYENAAAVYGFDLAALQPFIEQVGFDPRGAMDGAPDQEYVAHRDEPTGSARAR